MSNSSSKPRIREILEGAIGNITGEIVLIVLGVAGGIGGIVTLSWIPIFAVLFIATLAGLWYKFDPSFQRLFHQRLFKIRHAVSGHSVISSKWNLIANEAVHDIAKQNNLSPQYRKTQQRIILINGERHLEILLDYQLGGLKWLILVDGNGHILDSHGGYAAISGKCDKCNSKVLIRYWDQGNGNYSAEPETTCRRCRNKMNWSVKNMSQSQTMDVRVISKQEPKTKSEKGKVYIEVLFTVKNFGQATQVSPELSYSVATQGTRGFVTRVERKKLKPIFIPAGKTKPIRFTNEFPSGTVINTKNPDVLINNTK